MLEVKDAACGYGSRIVAGNISFTAGPGEIVSILGANGAGKTTLFKTILGHLRPLGGSILLNGTETRTMSKATLARAVGYVPQAHTPPFPYKVLDVVTMGRTAHISIFSSPSIRDEEKAREALALVGALYLEERIYTEISGGERQLVLIARALAQEPEILIMDEPTSDLDFGNQVDMLMLIKELAEKGLSVVMTTHFPDHALMCSSKVALIRSATSFVTGPAEEIITAGMLQELYGVEVSVEQIQIGGRTANVCVPLMTGRKRSC